MKKVVLIFILNILFVNNIYATNDSNISRVEYKWYKEEKIDGKYHPKQEKLSGYYEDEKNITYGNYSEWDNKYCTYDTEAYSVEQEKVNKYQKIVKTRYIKLELAPMIATNEAFNIIRVYYENQEINYTIVQNDSYGIKLELEKEYDTDKLHFYIAANGRFCIYLSNNYELTRLALGYYVMVNYIGTDLVPNAEWIMNRSTYEDIISLENIENTEFIRNIEEQTSCRVREIYTYRYKLKKVYYDDNYHVFVDGYIPDIKNSIVYRNNESKNQSVEVYENVISKTTNNIEPEEVNCIDNEIKKVYKTKYVTRSIKKIPIKIYILIIILILIIIFELIKIMKKKHD